MSFSDYLEAAALNHFFRNVSTSSPAAVYLALYGSDPTDTGSAGTEVSGGSYARQAITFGAPGATNGIISNSVAVSFPTASADYLSAANVTHFGILDAVSGGNMLASGSITTPKPVLNGERAVFDIGTITVTLS
jgi:hypothetical protein